MQAIAPDVRACPAAADALSHNISVFSCPRRVILEVLRVLAGLLPDLLEDLGMIGCCHSFTFSRARPAAL